MYSPRNNSFSSKWRRPHVGELSGAGRVLKKGMFLSAQAHLEATSNAASGSQALSVPQNSVTSAEAAKEDSSAIPPLSPSANNLVDPNSAEKTNFSSASSEAMTPSPFPPRRIDGRFAKKR